MVIGPEYMEGINFKGVHHLHILDGKNKFTKKGIDRLCEVIMRSFLKLYMLREDPKIARPATTGYSLYMDNIYLTARKNNVFPLKDPYNICGTEKILKTPLTVNDVIGSLCLNYPQTVSGIAIDLQRYIDKLKEPLATFTSTTKRLAVPPTALPADSENDSGSDSDDLIGPYV